MKGSIRMAVGFFIVMGAVGTLEIDNEASVLVQSLLGAAGLAIAWWGVQSMLKEQSNDTNYRF
jgi:hypothetical protein